MLIAHLSDLHLRNTDDVVKLHRQLDHVVLRDPAHLAITGDLLDRWNPAILDRALHVLEAHGFAEAEKLTIVHGNHDLASSGGHPRRRADLWRLVLRFWDPPPLVEWRKRRFYARIAGRDHGASGQIPLLKILKTGLRIAAIDTVPIPWKPLTIRRGVVALRHGLGCVDPAHARWLARQSGGGPLILLIHHYPLPVESLIWQTPHWRMDVPMEMPEPHRTLFWRAVRRAGAVLVLCGHVHRARFERHNGVAVGLNGQSGADWAGRTIAYYDLAEGHVRMETARGT